MLLLKVLERMKKFQKFIDQNNTKRTRAESLMAAEQQAINQANEEQERCDKQVRRLEQKAEKLRVSLSLLQVIIIRYPVEPSVTCVAFVCVQPEKRRKKERKNHSTEKVG